MIPLPRLVEVSSWFCADCEVTWCETGVPCWCCGRPGAYVPLTEKWTTPASRRFGEPEPPTP